MKVHKWAGENRHHACGFAFDPFVGHICVLHWRHVTCKSCLRCRRSKSRRAGRGK